MEAENYSLRTPDGELRAESIGPGQWKLTVAASTPDLFVARQSCVTGFPRSLVEAFLEHSGLGWVCDGIARHCDDEYVLKVIRRQLFSYFAPEEFAGKRILDFGCGSGGSTFGMGKLLPNTEIIGAELEGANVQLAQKVGAFRQMANVRVLCSPAPDRLPDNIGSFDFIMLSAVYEHLLPAERSQLTPLLWSKLKIGGALFVNQTPHRYFPYEHHSTGLWFVNYMPDRMAHRWVMSRTRFKWPDWNEHLRGGLRGATENEILRKLSAKPGGAKILQPSRNDLHSRADYWLAGTSPRHRAAKRAIWIAFQVTDKIFQTIPAMNIDVVIQRVA